MAAYFLFDNLEVRNADKLRDYKQRVKPVVARYGGRYVVLGGTVESVEGDWRPTFRTPCLSRDSEQLPTR